MVKVNDVENVVVSVLDFNVGIQISEGTMSCDITAEPNYVNNDKSKMILTIKPTKLFPSDTSLIINIPKHWPRILKPTQFNQILPST